MPSILHNNNIYLTILYKCSSLTQRRISLSIYIERTLYRTNVPVFRRYWLCHRSTRIKTRYIRVHLHRSIAYASDLTSNLQSWPIEQGRLKLIMYKNRLENENEILKKLEYNVRFLPVHKRPSYYSFRWNPFINKTINNICLKEPEVVRIINYPLVLTGSIYGKHVVLPAYQDYSLRLEQQIQLTRPKFSIIFWLYIDEYCSDRSTAIHCSILQHLTFNNTRLTPEIFLNRKGQIIVNVFEYLHDLKGIGAQTVASIPKKDWCRIALIIKEYHWNIYINCLQTWDKPIKANHYSPNYYYFNDEFGTFIVGGSDITPSFRGFISQIDIYRRIALTYEQLPKRLDISFMPYLPSIIQKSNECKRHLDSFRQCYEQFELFNKRIQQKFTCNAQPFLLNKSNRQCLLIRTWKQQLSLSSSSTDIRYRIFRALRRRKMNSTMDVANKLFDLTIKLLVSDNLYII
ncbi:unnamed protein product [Rotaria sordida]|uniref:Uncharacterized protein n=1 Tax=Rotaria sordida TaxID=392033 RepID=A0A814AER2_9BILA|nr:unnamed protein product [Rotaria sordida]CAF3751841.1 unnamed protein product [Rotaria sordida]